MITVLFGQPGSGKTTVAGMIKRYTHPHKVVHIDGDDLRRIFKNSSYSREGRMENLKRASDIALYMRAQGYHVIMSVVYPYQEAREYLNSLSSEVNWVYLKYDSEIIQRGREDYHVKDFEIPSENETRKDNFLEIDTGMKNDFRTFAEIIFKFYEYFD